MKKNRCYTYFRIVGDFDVNAVEALLGLEGESSHKATDLNRAGKEYGFAEWTFGRNEDDESDVAKQMERTIAPLLAKAEALKRIKEEYEVRFFLEVVPELYVGTLTPSISPSLSVIDFCHETRTEIDIDYYLYK